MKIKFLFVALFVTIILSCIIGVAENKSASVSFKINKISVAEQRMLISSQTADGGNSEETYIVVSIIKCIN